MHPRHQVLVLWTFFE
uniref:Uncharacterized protein n=1 Tax=Rhizophora mucronata TaxID=61149 RepID=A0A2P2N5C5_RHIMU